MGYYDTQRVAPNAGGQPYNVRDILLATQGVTGGLDKLVADAGVDRKAQQQMKANEYVSGLLGKATPENYQQTLLQAGSMAPYASPELMKQVDTQRAVLQRDEDNKFKYDQADIHNAQWGQDFQQKYEMQEANIKQMEKTNQFTREQIDNARKANENSYRAQMAGVSLQGKQLDAALENNKYNRAVSNATLEANGGLIYDGKGGFKYNPNSPTYMNNLNVAHNALLRDVGEKFDPKLALDNSNSKYSTWFESDAGVQGRINTAYELINTMTDVNDKKTAIQMLQSGDANRAFDLATRSIKSNNHKMDMKVNTKSK